MPALAGAPILKGAFRKAREAMQGDVSKSLTDALAKISQLRHRLAEIEAEIRKHAARFTDYVDACAKKFEASKSFENELAWALAECAAKWHVGHSTDPAAHAYFRFGIKVGATFEEEAFQRFAAENADWRTPISTGLKEKRRIAEQSLMQTEATVRRQLAGYSEEDVMNDVRLKSAKREVARCEGLEARFADAKDLLAWELGVDALLPE